MLRRNIGFSQTVSARALIISPPRQPGMPQRWNSATTLSPLAISTGATWVGATSPAIGKFSSLNCPRLRRSASRTICCISRLSLEENW